MLSLFIYAFTYEFLEFLQKICEIYGSQGTNYQVFATHFTISVKDKPIEDKKDIDIPSETKQDNSVEKVVKPKRTKKNFQCKECNKSFRDNYKLKRHEKVHMKMKLPEKTLDGQNLGEAYDSYLKGNLFRGIVNWSSAA